jgi:hypothetical protein
MRAFAAAGMRIIDGIAFDFIHDAYMIAVVEADVVSGPDIA